MCGIWAILGYQNPEYAAYVSRLSNRGPEFTTYVDLSGVRASLGFTRLAINGLTPAGNQPFVNNNTYLVCNGEIYNYKELAKRWNIPLAEGTSDCAVIPHLARNLGMTELCRTLDGVFAFVYVDKEANTVTVARDPYGVRPLFEAIYMKNNQSYTVWASEVKALPNDYISVKPFPPGTWRRYWLDTGFMFESQKYHTVPHTKMALFSYPVHRSESAEALRTALTTAVKKRLLSDRPVGALLSGGLDSSLVAAIAARYLRMEGKKLSTFSIGMPGSTDLAYAQKVADFIGSDHHSVVMTPEDFLAAIPNVIRDIESYDITTVRASVGNWLLGKYIRERTDIKVVFNGDGSDEIGGGYLYFYAAPSDEEFEAESERLLNEIHMYDVLRSDRSMAAHGLEARTPFLDKSVVATWRAIDTGFRRPRHANADGRGQAMEKTILREAFQVENYLPFDVLWRRKEAFSDGVSSASDSWYKRCQEHANMNGYVANEETTVINSPKTAEAAWYRGLFEENYGAKAAALIPHMWMPKWVAGTNDPSARTITFYTQ